MELVGTENFGIINSESVDFGVEESGVKKGNSWKSIGVGSEVFGSQSTYIHKKSKFFY